MKSKKPELPLYDLYSDNIYQTDNRQLAEGLGNWLNTNYSSIDATSPEFQTMVDAYTGDYNNRVKQSIANNYKAPTNQRLGSLNTGLYNTDMAGLANTDLNRRISSSNAQQYGSLANQYFNNQLANLTARYMQYVPSGNDINAIDRLNNNVTNQNLDRQYINAINKEAQKGNIWNVVKATIQKGPGGGISSALHEYTDYGGIWDAFNDRSNEVAKIFTMGV